MARFSRTYCRHIYIDTKLGMSDWLDILRQKNLFFRIGHVLRNNKLTITAQQIVSTQISNCPFNTNTTHKIQGHIQPGSDSFTPIHLIYGITFLKKISYTYVTTQKNQIGHIFIGSTKLSNPNNRIQIQVHPRMNTG